ncbi:MAG: FHA domain-containing protein [bacterium]
MHILKFLTKNKLSIGRGLNVDMRIPEISVSRNHASIQYING